MIRGDVFFAAQRGESTQKPRPVVVVQNVVSLATHSTIVCCLITSIVQPFELFRVSIAPSNDNGLDRPSQVMVDRIFAFERGRLFRHLGVMNMADMSRIDASLRRWLDI